MRNGELRTVDSRKIHYFNGHQMGLILCTHDIGINVVLTGRMEPRIIKMFDDLGIRVITDLEGDAGEVLHNHISDHDKKRSKSPHRPVTR
jgi:predicted Fe-Mo cluster-binding NifX family protein